MSVIQPVCLEVKQLFYIFSHFYCQPMASFNSKMLNILKIYVKFPRIQTHKNTEITTNATPIHLNSAAAQSLNKQFMLNVHFGTKNIFIALFTTKRGEFLIVCKVQHHKCQTNLYFSTYSPCHLALKLSKNMSNYFLHKNYGQNFCTV